MLIEWEVGHSFGNYSDLLVHKSYLIIYSPQTKFKTFVSSSLPISTSLFDVRSGGAVGTLSNGMERNDDGRWHGIDQRKEFKLIARFKHFNSVRFYHYNEQLVDGLASIRVCQLSVCLAGWICHYVNTEDNWMRVCVCGCDFVWLYYNYSFHFLLLCAVLHAGEWMSELMMDDELG